MATAPGHAPGPAQMIVEVWSDVVCSWCYIGKRQLERALGAFPHAAGVAVRWRSFELDPSLPADAGSADEELARRRGIGLAEARAMHEETERRGAELGIAFDFRRARRGNTFDAHRVLHMAFEQGCQPAVAEALMAAYFSEGEPIGDRAALARVAGRAGLDGDAVAAMLASERHAEEVRADEAQAAGFGITGVPFFVLDRRYALAGAQPADVLGEALQLAWAGRGDAL
jgi:predicted DsbA family dithiol-disulfide isomerase